MTKRRRFPTWVIAVLFFGIPLLELYVLIQVGQVIGVGWTILLLIADSLFGGWLIKHEGARAFRALNAALSSGRMPAKELADGILILTGGILMLSPGFVLDVVGLLLILPLTRPVARRALSAFIGARMVTTLPFGPGPSAPRNDNRPRPGSQGTVVEGEVVDDDPQA
ncbi:FxsA family protein [Nocardioides sp. JQ2195]|uniref:FxsA family protein n=1 Tax=Nocardioides sp. JQ2195 TaxID=2592334 RepID=UPI00143E58B6|nr:FxsA family protein [Nocardioides sp. JQ2195]QIX26683.1 FxsA family protein [Nocardioides sp. JQ2195]